MPIGKPYKPTRKLLSMNGFFDTRRFKPALISKGLRHWTFDSHICNVRIQTSPDFKGIKTLGHRR